MVAVSCNPYEESKEHGRPQATKKSPVGSFLVPRVAAPSIRACLGRLAFLRIVSCAERIRIGDRLCGFQGADRFAQQMLCVKHSKVSATFEAREAAGCGSLRLLRALDGTRILQAAAPTAPPCFGHWPRSSPLQTKGCSPLIIPKQMGSIQKIQVASLKDFLCCADLKSLARRNVRATACFHADVNAPAGSQHQKMPFAVTTLPVKK